jgi:hypothetical protein
MLTSAGRQVDRPSEHDVVDDELFTGHHLPSGRENAYSDP